MATKRVACPECSATVPYGRLSCPTCGTLLASVAGSTRRVSVRPNGRRSRGSAMAAVAAPGLTEPAETGQDGAPAHVGSWPPRHDSLAEGQETPPEPAWPETSGHETTEIFRQARVAAFPPAHPTNGATPPVVPDVLHDWAGPTPSVAAQEALSTGPGHAVRDFVASAAGAVASLGRAVEATAPEGNGRPIPGAYLAPSAMRAMPLHAGGRIAGVQRVASSPAVPGPNRWYSVPDALAGSAAPAMAIAAGASAPSAASVLGGGRSEPGSAAAPALTAGEAGLLSDLPFAVPNGPSGWATAVGSGLSALAVVLPWAKNGVAGAQLSSGYLGQWGLANPAYLLILAAGLALLLITILPNRLPRAIREVALPFVFGGFLVGLAWSYATGPFGTGLGVGTILTGAGLIVTGGALGLRGLLRGPRAGDISA